MVVMISMTMTINTTTTLATQVIERTMVKMTILW